MSYNLEFSLNGLFLLCCFFIIVFVETILIDFIFYKPPE